MNILITNDDGINAEGIKVLAAEASKYGNVYVAAPATQQSAKSQCITYMREVEIKKDTVPGAAHAYAVNGTPTDCVKWAVPWFGEKGIKFDYIFSGINMGANTGLAAYYSGTISAAREGGLHGIRSIALSVQSHEASEFGYILGLLPMLMQMSDSLSPSTVLSVNAPNLPAEEVKGVRIVEAAPWGYGESYSFHHTGEGIFRMDAVPLGNSMTAGLDESRQEDDAYIETLLKYDFDCMQLGYASISPLITHMSDEAAYRFLAEEFD